MLEMILTATHWYLFVHNIRIGYLETTTGVGTSNTDEINIMKFYASEHPAKDQFDPWQVVPRVAFSPFFFFFFFFFFIYSLLSPNESCPNVCCS